MHREHQKLSAENVAKLKGQALFKHVSEEDLSSALTRVEDLHLLKDELAFRKGERYHKGIYFALNGRVALTRPNTSLKIVCENEAVGLSTFLGKTMYTMNAVAETDCDLLFVHELCIYRLMELSDEFRQQLIKCIQTRLNDLENASSTSMMDSTFKSVGNCMSSPVISIQTGKSVTEASRLMSEHNISSLLVVNRKQIVKGLLTSKNLVVKFMTDIEENALHPEVERYMDTKPLVFPPEFPIVEALNEMQAAGATHALVNKNGKPAGVISSHDIAKILFENASVYCAHIDSIKTLDELKQIFSGMYRVAKSLATSSRMSREELTALSSIHHAIQKKVFKITSDEFAGKEGLILSDHRYCFLILGSGARREMDLRPQINYAVILDDETNGETFKKFQEFLAKFTSNLIAVGYYSSICDRRATGSDFVMRYSDWLKEVDQWASKTSTEIKSCFSCVTDMAAFDGDITLAWGVRNYMLKKIADKPSVMAHLITLSPPVKVPVSQFGSFIVEKDGPNKDMFNLQTQALHYLVNTTRLLSVYAGINDMSTVERIEHLARKRIIPEDMATQTIIAFDTIVETLINEQVNQSINGQPVTNYINPTSLSLFYQEKLKRALHFLTIYTSFGTNLLKEL